VVAYVIAFDFGGRHGAVGLDAGSLIGFVPIFIVAQFAVLSRRASRIITWKRVSFVMTRC
jgi:hypothetical protein